MSLRTGILAAMAGLGLVLLGVWWFAPAILVDVMHLMKREALETLMAQAGIWGPLLIIGLMTVAVVASPIPSAPIALAAGAAYGHVWGTVYVVIGAELGALIAFGLARVLGRDALKHVFGTSVDAGLLGSQNALTGTVFISRLMPFVSFDMISYAAGLSCLHGWRFALATLAGIIPASFLLAHVGIEAASGDMSQATWTVLGLGLVTGLPLLWIAIRPKGKKPT
ncbi:TVP38/TMEM64 family protein [Pseudorhodobacter sp.]|uniref:TVP38/TMEM64 family protein n=1 Tax=Pseudorhodobacter sp. TaxID=1934400 RepID=UPI0026499831|nr:VTT domain-containing protein [Pseudorhodobacter sp.]MDN5788859.1 VTT domain-containing protein [Pseudorhodobacter sp.]